MVFLPPPPLCFVCTLELVLKHIYLHLYFFFKYLTLSLILCRDVVAAHELGRLCSVRAGVLAAR